MLKDRTQRGVDIINPFHIAARAGAVPVLENHGNVYAFIDVRICPKIEWPPLV